MRHRVRRFPGHALEVERELVSDRATDDEDREQRGHDRERENGPDAPERSAMALEQAGLCDVGHL